MKLILDASVAVKLVAPEAGQDAALALLREPAERIAPEFQLVEVANTFWKKVQRGEFEPVQVVAGLEVVEDATARFVPDARLALDALRLSLELNHPVYDCLYLALAQEEDAVIVTDDRRLLDKARGTRLANLTRPLLATS